MQYPIPTVGESPQRPLWAGQTEVTWDHGGEPATEQSRCLDAIAGMDADASASVCADARTPNQLDKRRPSHAFNTSQCWTLLPGPRCLPL